MAWVRGLVIGLVLAGASLAAAMPASAQFYLRNPVMTGAPMNGDEADIGYQLPGATPAELRAGMTWAMRSALNVAALQCQFEPQLLAVDNYNAILVDHKAELAKSWATLQGYFARTNKGNKAKGTTALDHFGERLYSGYSTVTAQYIFCLTASQIATDAIFTKRGGFSDLAAARLRELRNSLKPAGEQQFPGRGPFEETLFDTRLTAPNCWIRKNRWDTKRCGPQPS
ncbi:hypothetical protein ACLB0R_02020 [Sphingomonas sp. GlSt437]|uniref:hypothetical protein n=1 Tax=Sphingomonas sp. GlSt437 TaxID=3389970 RepID=UPI003A844CA6